MLRLVWWPHSFNFQLFQWANLSITAKEIKATHLHDSFNCHIIENLDSFPEKCMYVHEIKAKNQQQQQPQQQNTID